MRRFLLILGLTLLQFSGCAAPVNREAAVSDVLGMNAVAVLKRPLRIEVWSYVAPDGTLYEAPRLRAIDPRFGRELAAILLDPQSYSRPAGAAPFTRSVGARISSDEDSIEIILSFASNQVLVKAKGLTGQPINQYAPFTAVRARMMQWAGQALPGAKLQ